MEWLVFAVVVVGGIYWWNGRADRRADGAGGNGDGDGGGDLK